MLAYLQDEGKVPLDRNDLNREHNGSHNSELIGLFLLVCTMCDVYRSLLFYVVGKLFSLTEALSEHLYYF